MGSPVIRPKMISPTLPESADEAKMKLAALQFSDTEKKLRASTGRKGSFLTAPQVFTPSGNTVLGA